MAKYRFYWHVIIIVIEAVLILQCRAITDPLEDSALRDLYKALNYPQQLKGWRSEGGDPCADSWSGVSCSNSSIISLQLSGQNLWGNLGSQLHHLLNLTSLDVSVNNIQGEIPNDLPPHAYFINMACNNLTQTIPYSFSGMSHLQYLNLSHNSLSGPVGNVFTGLQIKEMDLSYNNLTGDLPSSFGSLLNITALYLQNNKLTGSVIYLANLSLVDLNIEDNQFSGVIPKQFQFVPHLWIWGNKFQVDSNYQPWKFPLAVVPMMENASSHPTTESSAIQNVIHRHVGAKNTKRKIGAGSILFMVGGIALVASFVAFFVIRLNQARAQNLGSYASSHCTTYSLPVSTGRNYSTAPEDSPQVNTLHQPPFLRPRNMPPRPLLSVRTGRRKSFSSKCQIPACATQYTIAELQLATNSFSEENFLGEGSLGSVHRAEMEDGQFFVVKNISMTSLSLREEEQFFNVIQTASKLRHPNIVTLLGFCVEKGHHLLVYEYVGSLSLYDALHNEIFKPLSWGLRLSIALGVARALDYLHSSFIPPVAHSNLKAANILLDEELMPRLADCGLATLRPLTSNSVKLRASEMAVIHNTGYIAPDHGQAGGDGTESDIYAFGVLLLELLTGRKPFDSARPRGEQSLAKWASSRLHDKESLEQMLDSSIARSLSSRTLSRFADIISTCVQPAKEFRPPMSEIVESLTRLVEKLNKEACSTTDGNEDLFTKSLCSAHSRFMTSPTHSILST